MLVQALEEILSGVTILFHLRKMTLLDYNVLFILLLLIKELQSLRLVGEIAVLSER